MRKAKGECVMLVGHEPDLSGAIAKLTGGRVKLVKGGLAVVEMSADVAAGGLVSLMPPGPTKR